MIVFNHPQGSPEWHQVRAGFATASSFSKILATIKGGEAAERRNYRIKLVLERLTGRVVESGFKSAAMIQGTEREPLARAAYEIKTGRLVQEVGFLFDEMHQAGASPDGLLDSDGALELKSPEPAAHLEYLRLQAAPALYMPQIQGQMWISGRKWCDFVSFNPDFPPHLQLVIRRVERDEKYITGLQLAVAIFMSEVREEVIAMEKLAA